MTGSVALDVVIGLVFVFLLYSLLASIVQEIIANLLGLRARNLRHAISRMLEDEPNERSTNIVKRIVSDSRERVKRNILKKEEGLLQEFYDRPVIKYLASGHYFSKPSYIDGSDFTAAVMEILKEKGTGPTAQIDKIKQALSTEDNGIPNETRKHLLSLLDNAQNDLVKFKAKLGEWFDNTMERASGWYKRTIQSTLVVIGFVLAITCNINTVEIAKLLANDHEARNDMVALTSSYLSENKELIASFRKKKPSEPNADPEVGNGAADSAAIDFETRLDRLFELRDELETDMEDANNILGFRPIDDLPVKKKPRKYKLSSKQRMIDHDYYVDFPSSHLADKTKEYYSIEEKTVNGKKVPYAEFDYLGYLLDNFGDNFWGYLLTALAISLGAPFWFDLLGKLIQIRSSIRSKPKNTVDDSDRLSVVPINQRVG